MLTRDVDAAYDAIERCRIRAPVLKWYYRPGTNERAAIDELLAAIERLEATLTAPSASPPVE